MGKYQNHPHHSKHSDNEQFFMDQNDSNLSNNVKKQKKIEKIQKKTKPSQHEKKETKSSTKQNQQPIQLLYQDMDDDLGAIPNLEDFVQDAVYIQDDSEFDQEQQLEKSQDIKRNNQNMNKAINKSSKQNKQLMNQGSQQQQHSMGQESEGMEQRQNNNNSNSSNMNEQIQDLRMIFIDHFNSIEQPNGLVFKKQNRTKLRKSHKSYNWTEQHQLDPQSETQIQKKLFEINQMLLFKKQYHNQNVSSINEQQFKQYIKPDKQKIQKQFTQASYIFCQQVTPQLYKILRNLCDIIVQYKNNRQEMILRFRQYGDKIVSHTEKQHLYEFFGYQFCKFEAKMSEEQMKEQKREKFKYALRPQFKQPGTYFANLGQKAGQYLFKIVSKLKTFHSLK